MSARQNLAAILEQWLQLTREESAAIAASGWPALQRIQVRKAALHEPFAEALRRCAAADPAGESIPQELRRQAGKILSLLTRNSQKLAAQLTQSRARQEALDQVKRNLRRIRGCYSRARPSARWHSYS